MVRYHGVNRPRIIETIVDSHIVITTYNTLTTEYQLKSEPSRLHKIRWYRIILDEGKQNHSNVTSTTKLTYPQHTSSDDTQQYSTVPVPISTPIPGGVSAAHRSRTSFLISVRYSHSFESNLSLNPAYFENGSSSLLSKTWRAQPSSKTA